MPLHLDRLDHYVMAIPDLSPAFSAMTQLGIKASEPAPAGDTGNKNCFFNIGGTQWGVAIEYITVGDRARAAADPTQADLLRLVDGGGGAYFLGFPVESVEPAREAFATVGGYRETEVRVLDNEVIKIVQPTDSSGPGCPILLLEYPPAIRAIQSDYTDSSHDFPLKRVDHVAILPGDFEAATRYWTDVLGVPQQGELEGDGFVVRQMAVGDATVELLKPTDPSGRLAATSQGLLPMVAFEVDDIAAAVALARDRGFAVAEPGPGPLPSTLVTVIPPDATAGLGFQLMQYV
jgi:catechol 2,3-dioxygenase-like lactoylglutathione lyase family enzyme